MKQEAHWLKTMGSSPMIRWKKGQNIVTAQAVSEHFAVSYISVTIFTRLRLTLYRELHIKFRLVRGRLYLPFTPCESTTKSAAPR